VKFKYFFSHQELEFFGEIKKMTDLSKEILNKSIEYFNELNLKEDDYETIFERFKFFLNDSNVQKLIEEISKNHDYKFDQDSKSIVKTVLEKVNIEQLNALLEKIIKNEDFTNFIQDLILDKLTEF